MKKIVFILLSILALSCTSRELAVMSYNVGAFSKYEKYSLPDVADLIRQQGCDLVALNELDSCNRRHSDFQLQRLADELGGWQYAFASAFPFAGGAYGNGVVSALPIGQTFRLALPKADGCEPRSVAIVETDRCVFASVHLDFMGEEAPLAQAKLINEWFLARYSGHEKPVLLCGDMNSLPNSPVISTLEEVWERLSPLSFTFSTEDPHACIDYIFSLKSAAPVKVTEARVLTEGSGNLSDHFPVFLKLRY